MDNKETGRFIIHVFSKDFKPSCYLANISNFEIDILTYAVMGVLFFRFEIHKLQKKSLKMSSDLLCQRLFFARRTGPCAKSLTLDRHSLCEGIGKEIPLVNTKLPFD